MKEKSRKVWIVCSKCKDGELDPCSMRIPRKAKKAFPKNYCFMAFITNNRRMQGDWKRPAWDKKEQRLTT